MTIDIGHESQGLYHLSSTPSSIVCTSTNEPLLFHRRLGHLNIFKLWKMVSHFSSLSSLECESCQLGKPTRVSFPKRIESRTKSHFELLHTEFDSQSLDDSSSMAPSSTMLVLLSPADLLIAIRKDTHSVIPILFILSCLLSSFIFPILCFCFHLVFCFSS